MGKKKNNSFAERFEKDPCVTRRAEVSIHCPSCNKKLEDRMHEGDLIVCSTCKSEYLVQFDIATYISLHRKKNCKNIQIDLFEEG